MLSSCDVVKEYNLGVVITLNLDSLGTITRWIFAWVHVYDLSVSLVTEEETCVRVGVHSEVGGVS